MGSVSNHVTKLAETDSQTCKNTELLHRLRCAKLVQEERRGQAESSAALELKDCYVQSPVVV